MLAAAATQTRAARRVCSRSRCPVRCSSWPAATT